MALLRVEITHQVENEDLQLEVKNYGRQSVGEKPLVYLCDQAWYNASGSVKRFYKLFALPEEVEYKIKGTKNKRIVCRVRHNKQLLFCTGIGHGSNGESYSDSSSDSSSD
jgi:predicted methyltransferase